jgi:hypothetical protein
MKTTRRLSAGSINSYLLDEEDVPPTSYSVMRIVIAPLQVGSQPPVPSWPPIT